MSRWRESARALTLALLLVPGCVRERPDGSRIVVAMSDPAINLDPRVRTDAASQKILQLLFSTLVRIDEQLKVVPELAEVLEPPDPVTYVARAQQLIGEDVPYISLWYRTNVAIFQPDIRGVSLSPVADYAFLRHVYREHGAGAAH
jgi:ABC-type transport system substrate-binding protein